MINLLPPQEKQELVSKRNIKLAMVLGNMSVIFLVAFTLVLLSVKFYILAASWSQKAIVESTEKTYQTSDFLLNKNLIGQYNASLLKVDAFLRQESSLSESLTRLLDIQRPSGIYFTSIRFDRNSETRRAKATVAGISNTRENLLLFKENLEKSEYVTKVYFPPNNWIQPSEVNFYATIEFK